MKDDAIVELVRLNSKMNLYIKKITRETEKKKEQIKASFRIMKAL